MIKHLVKLKIIAIIQVNIEVLHMACTFQNIVHLKNFQQFFIIYQANLQFYKLSKTICFKIEFIAEDLQHAHQIIKYYEVLMIISLKEFIENVNINMIIENVEHVELNTNSMSVTLNLRTLKMIQQYTKVVAVKRIIKKGLMKT